MRLQRQGATRAASASPLAHPPRGSLKPQNPTEAGLHRNSERGEDQRSDVRGGSMELYVSTTASARATAAPLSFAPLRRGASASAAVPLRRRLSTRGWRCASGAAPPDPVPSEEPASASSTVVVTDKPDSPADEKIEEVSAEPNGSVEEPVAELVSSEPEASPSTSPSPSPDDGGMDEILDDIVSKVLKLNIEVTPTSILVGSGAFVALWILYSVVSAIYSVPLLPKLLQLVGTGYSIWFIVRYLLLKETREELFAKLEDLKQRII